MAKKTTPPWRITHTAIAELARQIAERFYPDRIILFGSHAYGEPHDDSDVDLLVIMPAKNMVNQAAKIRVALDYDFPLDLIVRTPEYLEQRLEMDDWFVREILSRGKVLYEKRPRGNGCEMNLGDGHAATDDHERLARFDAMHKRQRITLDLLNADLSSSRLLYHRQIAKRRKCFLALSGRPESPSPGTRTQQRFLPPFRCPVSLPQALVNIVGLC